MAAAMHKTRVNGSSRPQSTFGSSSIPRSRSLDKDIEVGFVFSAGQNPRQAHRSPLSGQVKGERLLALSSPFPLPAAAPLSPSSSETSSSSIVSFAPPWASSELPPIPPIMSSAKDKQLASIGGSSPPLRRTDSAENSSRLRLSRTFSGPMTKACNCHLQQGETPPPGFTTFSSRSSSVSSSESVFTKSSSISSRDTMSRSSSIGLGRPIDSVLVKEADFELGISSVVNPSLGRAAPAEAEVASGCRQTLLRTFSGSLARTVMADLSVIAPPRKRARKPASDISGGQQRLSSPQRPRRVVSGVSLAGRMFPRAPGMRPIARHKSAPMQDFTAVLDAMVRESTDDGCLPGSSRLGEVDEAGPSVNNVPESGKKLGKTVSSSSGRLKRSTAELENFMLGEDAAMAPQASHTFALGTLASESTSPFLTPTMRSPGQSLNSFADLPQQQSVNGAEDSPWSPSEVDAARMRIMQAAWHVWESQQAMDFLSHSSNLGHSDSPGKEGVAALDLLEAVGSSDRSSVWQWVCGIFSGKTPSKIDCDRNHAIFDDF